MRDIQYLVLVVGFLLVLAGMAFVLPIFALFRTRRIAELLGRVARLEDEVRQLQRHAPAGTMPAPVLETAPPVAEAELPEVLPVSSTEAALAPQLPPPPRPAAVSPRPAFDLEAWIGRYGLGWVAVVLLLFATAFFLKTAFDNKWIGELGRVGIGVLSGVALCLTGFAFHRRGWRVFSQMLTAAGVVLLYLTTFASFGYYYLLPRGHASFYLVALVVEAAALAILYEAPAIALMAIIGGLLTPLLLSTGHDQYQSLFLYLLVLNAGAVALALVRRWRALGIVGLLGTQFLFWGWYSQHYHPDKTTAALAFQGVLFGLYLAYSIVGNIIRAHRADLEDLARLVLNAFLFALALITLLYEDHRVWWGTVGVLLAFVYVLLGWLVLRRRPDDQRQLLVVVAVALSFVAAVFPLQTEAAWITVGWAAEGAALWWFGLRIRARGLRIFAAVLMALAVGKLITYDTPVHLAANWRDSREIPLPFLNVYGLPALSVVVCIGVCVLACRRFAARLTPVDRAASLLGIFGGAALLWFVLSLETYTYVDRVFDSHTAQTMLSAVWAAYAAVLLAGGFRERSSALRWSALGLFALTLAKVVLIDMAALPGFYRVAAFMALSVMMAVAACGYQKFQLGRLGAREEVADDRSR